MGATESSRSVADGGDYSRIGFANYVLLKLYSSRGLYYSAQFDSEENVFVRCLESQMLVKGSYYDENTGGGRGIRTPEHLSTLTVFKTAAFNHSAIPPATNVSNSGSLTQGKNATAPVRPGRQAVLAWQQ